MRKEWVRARVGACFAEYAEDAKLVVRVELIGQDRSGRFLFASHIKSLESRGNAPYREEQSTNRKKEGKARKKKREISFQTSENPPAEKNPLRE